MNKQRLFTTFLALAICFILGLAIFGGCNRESAIAKSPAVDVPAAIVLADASLTISADADENDDPDPIDEETDNDDQEKRTCPRCKGSGTNGRTTCPKCNGSGYSSHARQERGNSDQKIEPGADDKNGGAGSREHADRQFVTYRDALNYQSKNGGSLFVMITADHCAPCQALKARLRKTRGPPIALVNMTTHRAMAARFTEIRRGVPQLIRFQKINGQWHKTKLIGNPKTDAKLAEFLQ